MSHIKTLLWTLVLVFALNFLWGLEARAQSGAGGGNWNGFAGANQRAAQREASRWTLQDWLAQRDRNRMMDLWLSLNSPSPFEFMLGGSYLTSTTKVDNPSSEKNYISYGGELRAYAQFVGLTVEYSNQTQENFNDLAGMLNIRLFGNSLQNSSLTIHAGQRTRTMVVNGSTVGQRNVFGQVSLQIYLAKYFGIDSLYRQYTPASSTQQDETVGGNLTEAGLFIDFMAVRIFGSWYQDIQQNKNDVSGAESTVKRTGIKSGLKFFY